MHSKTDKRIKLILGVANPPLEIIVSAICPNEIIANFKHAKYD
jgi:hypothetical protein